MPVFTHRTGKTCLTYESDNNRWLYHCFNCINFRAVSNALPVKRHLMTVHSYNESVAQKELDTVLSTIEHLLKEQHLGRTND